MTIAFGGEFQPGLYKGVADRKFANPAPLGLSAFALTTFVLSLINLGARGLTEPNIVIALAFGYGGLVQLLAGMWYVHREQIRTQTLTPLGKWPWATHSVLPLYLPMVASGSRLPLSLLQVDSRLHRLLKQTPTARQPSSTLHCHSSSSYVDLPNDLELILTDLGMVHLHHRTPLLHAQVDTRFLPPVLHPRYGLPNSRSIIPVSGRRWSQRWTYSRWWRVRHPRSLLGLVQCICRYRGYLEQFLRCPGRSPSVVRDWQGKARKARRAYGLEGHSDGINVQNVL